MTLAEIFYKLITPFSFLPLLLFKEVKQNTYQANDTIQIELRKNSWDPFFLWSFFGRKNEADIQSSDVVLDIGAQIGTFTLYAAEKAKYGLVLAFEPEPQNFKLLKKNIKINNFKNVKVFRKAVLSHNGKAIFHLSDLNSGGHSIFVVDGGKEIEVPCVNLENILSENKIKKINFIKLNAEGAEFDIILNTPTRVFKRIDKLLIECHDFLWKELDHKTLTNFLKNEGYKVEEKGFRFGIGMGSIVAERIGK